MDLRILENPTESQWRLLESKAHDVHILQSWEWGELYGRVGVRPLRLVVLRRERPVGGLLMAAVWSQGEGWLLTSGGSGGGGGPVLCEGLSEAERKLVYDILRGHFFQIAKQYKNAQLHTFPGDSCEIPQVFTAERRQTPVVALCGDRDSFFAMLPKETRYDIEKAKKRGVVVREGTRDDLPEYLRLQTDFVHERKLSVRECNTLGELQLAYDTLAPRSMLRLFIAEHGGNIVAAVIILRSKNCIFYKSGMNTTAGRACSASHILQWQTILWGIENGCTKYNMMGGTDNPQSPHYPITQFKLSFGATLQSFWTIKSGEMGKSDLARRLYRRIVGAPRFPAIIYP